MQFFEDFLIDWFGCHFDLMIQVEFLQKRMDENPQYEGLVALTNLHDPGRGPSHFGSKRNHVDFVPTVSSILIYGLHIALPLALLLLILNPLKLKPIAALAS